ncbi:uncharacterized protein LOC111259299 isoform X2 [Varroa jacobsoni]|uniref:uncharacterized protein LOC111259299 isoform X2 n=1 Tax=Varroa jacobsoni TaxID=62625 RepID=UPI000BF2AC10|nr:uncharacterized protein LOC111259299 isoform X2 [Varroa jacobsoni]
MAVHKLRSRSGAQQSAFCVFLLVALCGRIADAQVCTEFVQEIIAKNDSLIPRPDKPPTVYLELKLQDCYLESALEELDAKQNTTIAYINLSMKNVTLSANLIWKRVIPFTVNGTLHLNGCQFEDEAVFKSWDISTVNELVISGRFPRVDPSQKLGKCRLYLEFNPLSCNENDHLVMQQRTREMLVHTPHCEANGTLVQFWFHNIKLCDVCSCSIHFDVDVDCSRRNLRELPGELPRETTHLNVSGNSITSLRTGDGAGSYKSLKYLDASWNFIDQVDDYDPHICSLVLLDLSHNRLRNLPKVLVKELTDILNCRPLLTIGKIMLGHNPWSCDCELLHFKRFIGVKGQDIDDFSMVRCQVNGEPVWSVQEQQLCPPPLYVFNPWDVAICVMIFLITGIILKTVADHYRQKQTGKLPKFFKF